MPLIWPKYVIDHLPEDKGDLRLLIVIILHPDFKSLLDCYYLPEFYISCGACVTC